MTASDRKNATVAVFLEQLRRQNQLYTALTDLLRMPEMAGASIYACGGMIRDAAIAVVTGEETASSDFDFVFEGLNADGLRSVLNRLVKTCTFAKKVIHAGKSFPIWKLKVDGLAEMVDMALARTQASFNNSHLDDAFDTESVSVRKDASRRDFTINAMYIRLHAAASGKITGALFDFHNGMADVEKRHINCVGKAEDRFKEDPLRMLRAIRFAARFNGFSISESTARAAYKLAAKRVHTISKERIGSELLKMLVAAPQQALQDLDRLGILIEILPQLTPLTDRRSNRICSRISLLRNLWEKTVDSVQLFAALLIDLALDELSVKMANAMTSAKMPAGFFRTRSVSHIAKQLRLGRVKEIANLCDDTVLLLHAEFIENREAVLEQVYQKCTDVDGLDQFYDVQRQVSGIAEKILPQGLEKLPPTIIDMDRLCKASGVPRGPHLQQIKLRLRQAEIDGQITGEHDAGVLLEKLYLEDTRQLEQHVDKIRRHHKKGTASTVVPAALRDEVRSLLYSKPVRLVMTYIDNDLLEVVFPELAVAEKSVQMTAHHFSDSFINDVLLALSLLYEENTVPSPVQVLSVLLLDIGMSQTRGTGFDGQPTYYNHASVGAEMAYDVCNRLGVDRDISSDVYFVVRHHGDLITSGGPNRFKKLIGTVDDGLLDDLLCVHRIDQLAKMKIHDGRRVEEGQLDHYRNIVAHRAMWAASDQKRKPFHGKKDLKPFVSGDDLQQSNSLWGPGVSPGPQLGKIKQELEQLQIKGIITTSEAALNAARNRIVLHHLMIRPDLYLENLHREGLLDQILPELAALVDLQQTGLYHLEDAYTHTLNVVRHLPADASTALRLAAVFHDIGKADTQTYDQAKGCFHFYGHEKKSIELLQTICLRFGWSDACFDQAKVNWLIGNHIRIQMAWADIKRPHKTIEKLFLRNRRTGNPLPDSYVPDLIRLRRADAAGADPADPDIKKIKEQDLERFALLFEETKNRVAHKQVETHEFERVKRIWNGRLAMKYYAVSGAEVGRLVRIGQDYVWSKLNDGKLPDLNDVMNHVERNVSGIQKKVR